MKTVKIEFNELSKSVTANIKIEYNDEEVDNEKALSEAKELFDKAYSYAQTKTMQKIGGM